MGLGPGKEDLYQKSVDRFGTWIQFEDAKAGAVLILLGLGFVDLLGHASRLIHAHRLTSSAGDVASVAFWIAIIAAASSVALVIFALKPRASAPQPSIFFFRTINDKFHAAEDYREAVEAKASDGTQLEHEMASQAWALAKILSVKVRIIGWAYWFVALFLITWGVARLALGIAT